jgi:hypothetical protein
LEISDYKKYFAICVDNSNYEASLILRKIYEIIPDHQAAQDDLIRIIDESGEDYLYHKSHFIIIGFPMEVAQVLLAATQGMTSEI